MLTGLIALLAFVLGVVVGLVAGVRGRHRLAAAVVTQLRPIVAATVAAGIPTCGICGLPANPLRTHDGHYRCAAHKGQ